MKLSGNRERREEGKQDRWKLGGGSKGEKWGRNWGGGGGKQDRNWETSGKMGHMDQEERGKGKGERETLKRQAYK